MSPRQSDLFLQVCGSGMTGEQAVIFLGVLLVIEEPADCFPHQLRVLTFRADGEQGFLFLHYLPCTCSFG